MAIVQHMVAVKFKPEVSPETIDALFAELKALKEKIPGILYVAGGAYRSPEGLNQGFTHGFLVTFESPAARDGYLPHPEHERVKEAILPCIDGVMAFDFEAE